MTADYTRSVEARDSAAATDTVKEMAAFDGYTVRTVKSVRLEKAGDMPIRLPRYRVVLAVDPFRKSPVAA